VQGLKVRDDYTVHLLGFMHCNTPSINNCQSIFLNLQRPIVYGELLRLRQKYGQKRFPLIDQYFFSEPLGMIFTQDPPIVLKGMYERREYAFANVLIANNYYLLMLFFEPIQLVPQRQVTVKLKLKTTVIKRTLQALLRATMTLSLVNRLFKARTMILECKRLVRTTAPTSASTPIGRAMLAGTLLALVIELVLKKQLPTFFVCWRLFFKLIAY